MGDSQERKKTMTRLSSRVVYGEAGSGDEPVMYKLNPNESAPIVMLKEFWRGCKFGLLDLHTIVMVAVACIFTFLCSDDMFDIKLETERALLSMGTIFPIIFTIKQSYTRREQALRYVASIKATCFGLYWIHRDFNPDPTVAPKVASATIHFLDCLKRFLHPEEKNRQEMLKGLFASMTAVNLCNWELMQNKNEGGKTVAPAHASRATQYVRFMIRDFELLRVIRDYRTPQGLRLFAHFVLHLLAVVMGPQFANYCDEEHDKYGCLDSYFTACMFFTVVLTLYHVQEDLEDPFDGNGWDDINLEIKQEIILLMTLHPDPKLCEHPGLSEEAIAAMRLASVYIAEKNDSFASFDPNNLAVDE